MVVSGGTLQTETLYHKKYGPVQVVERTSRLTRIQVSENNAFWLTNADLINSIEDPIVIQLREKRNALAARKEQIVNGNCATCSREELVKRLLNTEDYLLRLDATEEGIEIAQSEYITWTGESFPDELINLELRRPQPRRWRFEFIDAPGSAYPFPVIHSQEVPYARLHEGARGWWKSGRIFMHYAEEVERLVRLGLRAR